MRKEIFGEIRSYKKYCEHRQKKLEIIPKLTTKSNGERKYHSEH
jgi:hypothetical protein